MIREHVLLPVRPGQETEFEAAFGTAKAIIAASPGFLGLTLSRGIESTNTYLMVVEWETLEAHQIGFRESAAYGDWKALLHHFYDPFPVVEHFADVATA